MASEIETRVSALERALRLADERATRMERNVEQMARILRSATAAGSVATAEDDAMSRLPGRYWHCQQCNIRLGFHREDTDELRLKYKEFIVIVRPGPDCTVKIPCVKCGHENVTSSVKPKA